MHHFDLVGDPPGQETPAGKLAAVVHADPLRLARAMVAEMVWRYWVLGSDCTYLEVQKLGWFLERAILKLALPNSLNFRFTADRYGPYSDRLRHVLNGLHGSYLHCDKRLGDAGPTDTIWFDQAMRPHVDLFWKQAEHRHLLPILEETVCTISGFESPLGMELLATVDWLIERENCGRNLNAIRVGLKRWPAGAEAAERKLRLFDDRMIGLARERLNQSARSAPMPRAASASESAGKYPVSRSTTTLKHSIHFGTRRAIPGRSGCMRFLSTQSIKFLFPWQSRPR